MNICSSPTAVVRILPSSQLSSAVDNKEQEADFIKQHITAAVPFVNFGS